MNAKKKALMIALVILLAAVVAGGVAWSLFHYHIVDFRFYAKDAENLDLRQKQITTRHYDKIRRKLPDCEILWNVPFQEGTLPSDAKEVSITALSEEEVDVLCYLTDLETVRAEQCADYPQLLHLRQRLPETRVLYAVPLNGEKYDQDTKEVTLSAVTAAEIDLLRCLPDVTAVTVDGKGSMDNFDLLRAYCHEQEIDFRLSLAGEAFSDGDTAVTVTGISNEDLPLLQLMPQLETLHLDAPKADAERIVALRQQYPGVQITWNREICGKTVTTEDRDIDLSDVAVTELGPVEEAMAYFPDAVSLYLGEPAIENEEIAAYRERVREDYKVVWTVTCGKKLKTRTDATFFYPTGSHVYYFNDEEAYNLRYCEDMICIDIGHMSIHNIDFVAFMPNLQYLILAHTQVQYIEPIRNCKKLKFLELDWSCIRDYSPLEDCTALEDLNIGKTYANIEPITRMTWLKNLWMIQGSTSGYYKAAQALPDTKVVFAGDATVASGWRNLPNYFAMRDALGAEYMTW